MSLEENPTIQHFFGGKLRNKVALVAVVLVGMFVVLMLFAKYG